MDSRKYFLAILGGMALTSVIGILLISYRDTPSRNKIVDKARDYTDRAEETTKDSVASVKKRLENGREDAEQMINEGGNVE